MRGFLVEAGGHLGQGGGVNLHSGFFHAGQHGNEREIDFFVELGYATVVDFGAQGGGEASGEVSGLRQNSGELEIEAAQRGVGEGV